MASVALDLRSTAKAGVPNDLSPGPGLFIDAGHLWAGPWQWHVDLDLGGFWGAPTLIDPVNYVDLGSDPLARMSLSARRELERRMGYAEGALPDSNLADILSHYILGTLADPTGQNRVKPLRMGRRGLELYLGSFGLVLEERFSRNHPNFDATLAVRMADYRRNKAAGIPLEALRRWTGHDMQALYGRMGDDLLDKLVPEEFLEDGWGDPATTFADDFGRANENLEASTDWTKQSGGAGAVKVVSGQASGEETDAVILYHWASDLSSDDHRNTTKLGIKNPSDVSSTNYAGLPVRMATAAQDHYWTRIFATGTDSNVQHDLFRTVTGSSTRLSGPTTVTYTFDTLILCETEADGSAITGIFDKGGVNENTESASDMEITGELRPGLRHFINISNAPGHAFWDDFEAADLEAAAGINSAVVRRRIESSDYV